MLSLFIIVTCHLKDQALVQEFSVQALIESAAHRILIGSPSFLHNYKESPLRDPCVEVVCPRWEVFPGWPLVYRDTCCIFILGSPYWDQKLLLLVTTECILYLPSAKKQKNPIVEGDVAHNQTCRVRRRSCIILNLLERSLSKKSSKPAQRGEVLRPQAPNRHRWEWCIPTLRLPVFTLTVTTVVLLSDTSVHTLEVDAYLLSLSVEWTV